MRIGPAAHGVLLGVALIVAYQTWTRDETEDLDVGDYVVWQEAGPVEAVIYDTDRKSVRIERREDDAGDYLWGIVKRSRPNPQANEPEPEPASEGDDAANSETAEADTPEPAMITTTREFPVGEAGKTVIDNFAGLRALRDLGVLDEETKQKYELHESTDNLTVLLSGDEQRTLVVGKRVYGGSDRYVLDPQTGKGYVISTELMRPLEGAENALDLESLHDFEDDEVTAVTVKTAKGEKKLVKTEVEDEAGGKKIAWAYAETPKEADLTVANFLDRAQKLSPREYDPELGADALVHLATFRFYGEGEKELGYLELYRQTPDMQKEDDTDALGNPLPGPKRTQYWIRTEKTRALGKASPIAADRVDNDLVELFGIEAPPPPPEPTAAPGMPPGAHGAMPHGAPDPHAGMAADPHGHGAGARAPAAKPAADEPVGGKPGAEKPARKPAAKPAKKPAAEKPAKKPAAKPATDEPAIPPKAD